MSMATVHGGAGGGEGGGEGGEGGEDDPKSSGSHCGGTAVGFDVVGLIVVPMLTLSMRARSCDRARAWVVGLILTNHPVGVECAGVKRGRV